MTKPKPKKKKPGRKTDWRPEFVEQAGKLAKRGWLEREIADFYGKDRRTLLRWKNQHPELEKALVINGEAANARVELSLYEQAIGYERDEEEIKIIEGRVERIKVKRFYPPNVTAGIFWAKAKGQMHDNPAMRMLPAPMADNENETLEDHGETLRQFARRLNYVIEKRERGG